MLHNLLIFSNWRELEKLAVLQELRYMFWCHVKGLPCFNYLPACLGMDEQLPLKKVSPVRALAHVFWKPFDQRTKVRTLQNLIEGEGDVT